MPQAARSVQPAGRAVRDRHLRVVPRRAGRVRATVAQRRTSEARARAVFNAAAGLIIVLTLLGLARVAVVARAADMTLSAGELTKGIKDQRLEAGRLEIDRSALATPSRIESIAVAALRMGHPASVRYLSLGGGASRVAKGAEAGGGSGSAVVTGPRAGGGLSLAGVTGFVASLAEMSTGEAQMLLVGDVGLVGAR